MYDFLKSALPWVLFSTALAIVLTYMNDSKKTKEKNK